MMLGGTFIAAPSMLVVLLASPQAAGGEWMLSALALALAVFGGALVLAGANAWFLRVHVHAYPDGELLMTWRRGPFPGRVLFLRLAAVTDVFHESDDDGGERIVVVAGPLRIPLSDKWLTGASRSKQQGRNVMRLREFLALT
jgi:hypothetical protein